MDWVVASSSGIRPAIAPSQPTAGVKEAQAVGSYDAIRVYLWLGLADPATPGQRELLAALPGMATYLRTALTPPLQVDAQGHILNPDSPPGFSAAVIPYLMAEGVKAQATTQMVRLQATQDSASGLYGHEGAYYDQNLAMFSTALLGHRYHFEKDGRLKVAWK
jgi:endoglucanase